MSAFAGKSSKKERSEKSKTTTPQTTNEVETVTEDIARWGLSLKETEDLDDWASEWQEVLNGNGVWGGRTRGGRGVARITGRTKDISVEGITLAFCGKELLQKTNLKFLHGHRYGIIGENGVGKSTLLRRLARQSLPGVPLHFRFGYVQQELALADKDKDVTVLDYILRGRRASNECLTAMLDSLHEEEVELENQMEGENDSEVLSTLAERLCSIAEEMETIEGRIEQRQQCNNRASGSALVRADVDALGEDISSVLDGLGLSKPLKRLSMTMSELSGGWRVRAALAQTLCNVRDLDVLLLDEPTNHLDLPAVAWLARYLAETNVIALVVSHDRSFLDTVCTDTVVYRDLALTYHPGSFSEYERQRDEMAQRNRNAIDARQRKQSHIQKTIDNASARGDDRTVRSKQKKLERAAFTKSIDGHRFKLFSLSKLDESAVHMPEYLESERNKDAFQSMRFRFPTVDKDSLRLPSASTAVMSFDDVSLSYAGREKEVLTHVSLSLSLQSRVGIVGRNGRGKTTLLHALAFAERASVGSAKALEGGLLVKSGSIHRHHNLRVALVSQHQIDVLSRSLAETPVSLLATHMPNSGESELRAHLGCFGLTHNTALQPIGSLSGGQKARLSFAIVCAQRPHLLMLDEPTNHLSIEATEQLIHACQQFSGGLVVVSHNKHFLSSVCEELFVIDNKNNFSVRKPLPNASVRTSGTARGGGSGSDSDQDDRSAFVDLLNEVIKEQMK